ncbi:MAG TPA: transketolase [Thermoplasmata archaeon]|nr:transketolase [Thermoplasmata archaeon]
MSTPEDLSVVNTLRFLAVDMVEKANSGHPGLPLGAAPMAYALWKDHLRFDPHAPDWANRDRFVLSAGHGSALLYAVLHVTGYDLPIEQLQQFRQFGSRTPGHPEVGLTPGVEATTGPLGQGFAMGVGLAIAERVLAARFNRDGFPIIDHWTYAICSDGDLMEGIASEAASLAGHLRPRKLVYLYDDNHVSLEGPTRWTFTESVEERFRAYGWRTQHVADGTDIDAIGRALTEARQHPEAPHLIRVTTHIGYGSPRQDTREAHGEPLGAEGTRQTKLALGWPLEPAFRVPVESERFRARCIERGAELSGEWRELFERYRAKYPELAREFEREQRRELPEGWDSGLRPFPAGTAAMATRDASAQALQVIAAALPNFLGGSADLNPSTKTHLDQSGDFSFEGESGRNLHFGVRENSMVGVLNGLALHEGLLPFGSTFLIFSDYARPAIRLSALMGTHLVLVFTHDSIALGEDGPSHEPIEQIPSLRAIPHLTLIRPADANETIEAWRIAVTRPGPVALVLTRQKLPQLPVEAGRVREGVARGAYVVHEGPRPPEVVLLGTGSEVSLCLAAAKLIEEQVRACRVVSMPSWELFMEQEAGYHDAVLPPDVPVLAVEAARPIGWERFTRSRGGVLGLDRFGASAPGPVVMARLGFTPENVRDRALALLGPRAPGVA